jgi:general secretion pathway protein D
MAHWAVVRRHQAAILLLAIGALPPGTTDVRAQDVEVRNDSIQVRLTDTDIRAAIQALGRFLSKPVVVAGVGQVRVEFFETPVPVARENVPSLLRDLVEAHGLVYEEGDDLIRVAQPGPEPAPSDVAQQVVDSLQAVPFQLFAVRLRHASAANVAATLNQLYGAGQDLSRPAGLSTGTLSDELRGGQPPEAAELTDVAPQGAALRSPVTIVPDELTNSLLIRATAGDFEVLQEGIAQLDIRPLQVLIEVVIVEARKDRDFFLGFEAAVPPRPVPGGGTVEASLFGGGLGDLVIQVMSLGRERVNATLSAARSRGDVEILSRPVLLASNNTEASLLVGTQQPFVQVSRSLPTDVPQRDQVVQYRDVGTKLTVLPTINQDGYVSLLVQQEISAATGETQFSAPVISSRETVTRVLVRDGQTIVIGGLQDSIQDTFRSGIPLLADIPLLGALFGSTRTRSTETELFLFITPTIIASDEDIGSATLERVPERLLEMDFMRIRPVTVPPIPDCLLTDPECGS